MDLALVGQRPARTPAAPGRSLGRAWPQPPAANFAAAWHAEPLLRRLLLPVAGLVRLSARMTFTLYLTHLPGEDEADALLAEARAAFGGPVDLAVDQGTVEI